jgi:hypothetical protein
MKALRTSTGSVEPSASCVRPQLVHAKLVLTRTTLPDRATTCQSRVVTQRGQGMGIVTECALICPSAP